MAGHSRVIGVYLPMLGTHGPRVMQGLLRYVEKHPGLSVCNLSSFENSFFNPTAGPPTPTPPWAGRVNGATVFICRELVEWARRGGVPVVNTINETVDTPIVSVFTGFASSARMAIDHLTGLSYRHFAYVGARKLYGSQLRRDALVKELANRNLRLHNMVGIENPTPQCNHIDEFTRLEQANPLLLDLVKSAKKPLALITESCVYAGVLCRIIGWLGLRIPEDVALLCLVDSDLARANTPPLTAIRSPSEQIGYEAARLLHRMMEGKRIAHRDVPVAATELVVRESTVRGQHAADNQITYAQALIRERAFEKKIRVDDIAAQMCMSVRTLQLQYAAAFGYSVGEEMRRVRVRRVKELLDATELSVTQIAKRVGYSNAHCLATFFQRRTKLTPAEYRRRKKVAG